VATEVDLRRYGRHLENRSDVIIRPTMVQFGWRLVYRCWITCRWRRKCQNGNRK